MVSKNNEKDSSKVQLTISIIALIIVIILLIIGVALFFIIRERENIIEVDGTDVDIEATATIEGMENPPTLEPIIITPESQSEHQSWQNIDLVFPNEDSVITIAVTVMNNSEYNALDIVFDNRTTTENINMVQEYYLNGNSGDIQDLTINTTRISAYESITYVLTFTIKDVGHSVNDTLAITISCTNVEVGV